MEKVFLIFLVVALYCSATPPDCYSENLTWIGRFNKSAVWLMSSSSNMGYHGINDQTWEFVILDFTTGTLHKEQQAGYLVDLNSGDRFSGRGKARDLGQIISDAMKGAPVDEFGQSSVQVEDDYYNSKIQYSNPSSGQYVMHYGGISKKIRAEKSINLYDSAACPTCKYADPSLIDEDGESGSTLYNAQRSLSVEGRHLLHFYYDDELTSFNTFVLFPISEWNSARSYLFNAVGLKLHKKKKYDEAIEHYRYAIGKTPSFYIAHYNLACAWALKGEVSYAISKLRKAETLKSRDWVLAKVAKDSDFDAIRDSDAFKNYLHVGDK